MYLRGPIKLYTIILIKPCLKINNKKKYGRKIKDIFLIITYKLVKK